MVEHEPLDQDRHRAVGADVYLDAMRKYVDFDGRMSRRDYWIFMFVAALCFFAAHFIDTQLFGTYRRQVSILEGPLGGIVAFIHLLPTLAATSRRLHDLDTSGWWQLFSITLVGGLVVLAICLVPGTGGANRFGLPAGSSPGDDAPERQKPADGDLIAQLERLAQLRSQGIITDDEFDVLKTRALGSG